MLSSVRGTGISLRRAGNERLIHGGNLTPASSACGPARHDGQLSRLDADSRFRGRSAVRRLPACRSWSGFGQSPAARRATRTRTVSRRSQTKTDQLPRHERHFLAGNGSFAAAFTRRPLRARVPAGEDSDVSDVRAPDEVQSWNSAVVPSTVGRLRRTTASLSGVSSGSRSGQVVGH